MTTLPLDRPDPTAPPADYRRLREHEPVARVVGHDGAPAWLVTSHDLVATGLADPRLGLTPPGVAVDERASLFRDGPAHTRLRRLVARAFTPRRVAELAPRVEALAEEHVAALVAAADHGPADLVDLVGAPLAVGSLGLLLGVPLADHPHFRGLVDDALRADPMAAAEDPALLAEAERAWGALMAFTAELVAAARETPGDDLLGTLVAVRDADDGRLDDGELVALVTALLAAGVITVRGGLAVAVVRLLADDLLAGLADHPDVPGLVDELVRRTGVEVFPRWAQENLELGGVAIAAGDRVLLRLEAANHDPARFAEPEALRPGRAGPHLGFGRGPHHCLGAALARLELTAALTALSRRAPGLRLAVPLAEVPWHRGEVDSGPLALPVVCAPRS
ncbi:cytochrome P450 [Actinomycetospora straminea]|uniref:Cytochrome P450 n=1 Tax=Actinomycetospora straminea TaxID=663607 RepID=A0ABP9E1F0_9PSEU|nr:cytochrome P450 [Actinomycetospora straminea]MDD7931216.1 cytochrome P450 [Actinomycetospora straminea]